MNKPTGWLGELIDKASVCSEDPVSEIEKMAKQALSERVIDKKRYNILRYRLPFNGFNRETLKQVAGRLGIGQERSRQLEYTSYTRLKRYFMPY